MDENNNNIQDLYGAPVPPEQPVEEKQVTEPMQSEEVAQPVQPVEQSTQSEQPVQPDVNGQQPPKKKGKGGLIALIIILILILVGGGIAAYFLLFNKKPAEIFKAQVSSVKEYALKTLETTGKGEMSNSMKLKVGVEILDKDIKKEINNNDSYKSILDLINDATYEINTQYREGEAIEMAVELKSGKDSLFDGKAYLEKGDDEVYFKSDLLSEEKTFKTEIPEDYQEYLDELFNLKVDGYEKMVNAIATEIEKMIKDEYCSKVDGDLNGKKVTKYVYTLDAYQTSIELTNLMKNLKANEDFMSGFGSYRKDMEKEMNSVITRMEKNVPTSEEEINKTRDLGHLDYIITLNGTEFVSAELAMVTNNTKGTSSSSGIKLEKIGEDKFKYTITPVGNEDVIEGTFVYSVKGNTTHIEVPIEIEEKAKVTIELDVTNESKAKFSDFNKKKAIDFDDIRTDTNLQQEISNNLQNSKLYKLIYNLSTVNTNSYYGYNGLSNNYGYNTYGNYNF